MSEPVDQDRTTTPEAESPKRETSPQTLEPRVKVGLTAASEDVVVYSAAEVRRQRIRRTIYEVTASPSFLAGIIILTGYVLLALWAVIVDSSTLTVLTRNPQVQSLCAAPPAPTFSLWPFSIGPHPLGVTAVVGLDVWQGLFKGGPWDLLLLGGTLLPSLGIGLVLGSLAGTMGGTVDTAIMAGTDAVLSVPSFFVALLFFYTLLPILPPGERTAGFAMGLVLVLWAPFARTVRASARSTTGSLYVESARASGAGRWRIMMRHVLPNSATPVLAQTPATLATILFIMTSVQFLAVFGYSGTGSLPNCDMISPNLTFLPTVTFPEWSWILASGAAGWAPGGGPSDFWWGYIIPAIWIVVFGLAVNLVCDGLRDLFSPIKRH